MMILQGLSGPAVDMKDPVIGLLFSLVAASAHVIVPAAVFNLKVLLCTHHFNEGSKPAGQFMHCSGLGCFQIHECNGMGQADTKSPRWHHLLCCTVLLMLPGRMLLTHGQACPDVAALCC